MLKQMGEQRRQLVDIHDLFPEQCRTVLEALKIIYHNDAVARQEKMSPGERLQFHQALSHTCELNQVNPFDYLTELMSHPEEVAAHPERFMPWNYREALAGAPTAGRPAPAA